MKKVFSMIGTVLSFIIYGILSTTFFLIGMGVVFILSLFGQLYATCILIIHPFLKKDATTESYKDIFLLWLGRFPVALIGIAPVIMEKVGWIENSDDYVYADGVRYDDVDTE